MFVCIRICGAVVHQFTYSDLGARPPWETLHPTAAATPHTHLWPPDPAPVHLTGPSRQFCSGKYDNRLLLNWKVKHHLPELGLLIDLVTVLINQSSGEVEMLPSEVEKHFAICPTDEQQEGNMLEVGEDNRQLKPYRENRFLSCSVQRFGKRYVNYLSLCDHNLQL